jgi:hypothetical protein
MINLSQEAEAPAKRLAATQSLSVEDAIKLALEENARAAGIAMEARRPRDQSPEAVAARRARTGAWRSLRPCGFSICVPRATSWTILMPHHRRFSY